MDWAWICHRERREHREPPVRGFPAIFLATPESAPGRR